MNDSIQDERRFIAILRVAKTAKLSFLSRCVQAEATYVVDKYMYIYEK